MGGRERWVGGEMSERERMGMRKDEERGRR